MSGNKTYISDKLCPQVRKSAAKRRKAVKIIDLSKSIALTSPVKYSLFTL
jgi:hypothetical protein